MARRARWRPSRDRRCWRLQLAAVAFALYALVGGVIGSRRRSSRQRAERRHRARGAGHPDRGAALGAGLLIAVAIIVALDLFEQETDRALAAARRRELLARERSGSGATCTTGSSSRSTPPACTWTRPAPLSIRRRRCRGRASAPCCASWSASATTSGPPSSTCAAPAGDAGRGGDRAQRGRRAARQHAGRPAAERRRRLGAAPHAEQAAQLHQIVHEAFSNVLRHASAPGRGPARLLEARPQLEIRDDGAGFDAEAVAERDRSGSVHGLPNMRRRAELLGATSPSRALPDGARSSPTMPVATAAARPEQPETP